jgi:hypothetical protein
MVDFDLSSLEGEAQLQTYIQVQQGSNDGGNNTSKSFLTKSEWLDSI